MKNSKYNFTLFEGKDYIVCNLLSGKFVKFPGCFAEKAYDILENSYIDDVKSPLYNYMISNGFLVEETVDEEKECEKKLHAFLDNSVLELIIFPTMSCDLKCIYCYEDHEALFMNDDVENSIVLFLENNLDKYKGLHIDWFGGEPLCAVDRITSLSKRMMDVCAAKRKPYIAGMTTNGYALTPDLFKKLRKLNIIDYQITIDGPRDIHNQQRPTHNGLPSYETIIDNLSKIRDQNTNGSYSITIRTNFTKEIQARIKEFIDFMAESFGHNQHFSFLWKTVGNYGGNSVKSIEKSLLNGIDELNRYRLYAIGKGMSFLVDRNRLKIGGAICYGRMKNSFVITPEGKLMKCTVALEMKENQIGYLNANGEMVFNSNLLFMINPVECKNMVCKKRPICSGAPCPIRSIEKSDEQCFWSEAEVYDTIRFLARDKRVITVYSEES